MLRAHRDEIVGIESYHGATKSRLWQQRGILAALAVMICLIVVPGAALADYPPVANDDYGNGDPNTQIDVDILVNDYGVEIYYLDPYSIWVETYPVHGAVSIDYQNGIASYMPDTDWAGWDEFWYSVCDAYGNRSNHALVDIEIFDGTY